jgi:hypothetical protein
MTETPERENVVRVALTEGGKLYAFQLAGARVAAVGDVVRVRGHRAEVMALGRGDYDGPLAEATLLEED